jgi:phage terminase large subunit-like protein
MKVRKPRKEEIGNDILYYANLVKEKKIKASKKVVQAAERFLNDLEKSKDPDFEYEFKIEKVNKVIKFMEMLPDISTGKAVNLALFQKFIIGNLYGWVSKKTGYRRFTKAYISMARKNGKSVLISGLAIYELLLGEYPKLDRQIYASANSREQARIVYKMIVSQLKKLQSKSDVIKKQTKILQNEIRAINSDSVIKPVSKEANSLDGLNTLMAVLDEYHASKTTEILDVMESSQSQQKQPLIIIISTAGFNLNSPMAAIEYPYITNLLEGKIVNENYFAICYEQDSLKELNKIDYWIKSNPLLEIDDLKETMISNISKKLSEAREKNNLHGVIVKNFNMWQSASKESYINADDWNQNKIEVRPEIKGRNVYIGVDLSRTIDLSSISYIIPIDEQEKFFVDSFSFVGTKGGIENKIKKEKIDYIELEKKGYCSITTKESGVIDYKEIINYIKDFVELNELTVKGIMYDEYSAAPFITELEDIYPLINVRQGLKTLSPATKSFKIEVLEGNILHLGNPLLDIAINNSVLTSINDAVMIDKKVNRNKIDPIAALINGWVIALDYEFNEKDLNEFYNSEDFSF